MLALDRDAVICDFAETYGVLDIRALPVTLAATLAQGLPDKSRIKRKISGAGADTETALLAIIADRLGHLAWMISEDGSKGKNHPKSILTTILGGDTEPEAEGYDSGEEFLAAWNAAGGEDNGN